MIVKKSRIVEILRERGQDSRAEWVDRVLPDEVDTVANAGLLGMLRVDASEFAENRPHPANGS
jgi:hypothetical protein